MVSVTNHRTHRRQTNELPHLSKPQLRAQLTAARAALSPAVRSAAHDTLTQHAVVLADGLRVAAYAPFGSEPGGPGFVATLADAASELWLPISGPQGQLEWAQYTGPDAVAPGALGIIEPAGPRRDSGLLSELDLILVPALGVNSEGYRLGKGAGYYDRALAGVTTRTIVVLYDNEVHEDIPAEPHDVPVTAMLTPSGVQPFPLGDGLKKA